MAFPLIKTLTLCILAPLFAGCTAYPRQYHYSGYSAYPAYPTAYYHGRQPYFRGYPIGSHVIIQRELNVNPRPNTHWIYSNHPHPHGHDDGNHHPQRNNKQPDNHKPSHGNGHEDDRHHGRNRNRSRKNQGGKPSPHRSEKKTGRRKMPATPTKRTPKTNGQNRRNRR